MIRARSLLAALSLTGAAVFAAGCADTRTVYLYGTPGGVASTTSQATAIASPVPPCAPCAPVAQVPVCPPPCAPAPVCAPPPCAPPPPVCGLPCERGESDWHVRVLGGKPFLFGTDAGHGCSYWGADVGTTRCNCVGYDAFYRTMSCDDEPGSLSPGTSPTAQAASRAIPASFDRNGYGKDGGRIQFVGVKATYQSSIGHSAFYGYGGIGPEYFWTQKYIDNDSGFGGFAEAGIGWHFASWGSLRAGVDVHGDSTSVTRKAVADSGQSRFLWTVAPTLGLEFDF